MKKFSELKGNTKDKSIKSGKQYMNKARSLNMEVEIKNEPKKILKYGNKIFNRKH